jgi:hypothetical protein
VGKKPVKFCMLAREALANMAPRIEPAIILRVYLESTK